MPIAGVALASTTRTTCKIAVRRCYGILAYSCLWKRASNGGVSSVVWFIVVVALINACVGYGLAVCLGYGPPGLGVAWSALGSKSAADSDVSRGPLDGLTQQIVVAPQSAPPAIS
jgi:hypothetical protein